MKKNTHLLPALLLVVALFSVIPSCDVSFVPPITKNPALQACQLNVFFYMNAEMGGEGFPESFTSPMQNWCSGMTAWDYNSQGNPAVGRGAAQATWDFVYFEYYPDNTIKRILQHAYGGLGGESGPVCMHDTCQKAFVFTYDNNTNPVKITGEVRDFFGVLLSTFPVCDNEFDTGHRLTKQTYPNGSYWRFEYSLGNLSKMFYKGPVETTEHLVYQFLSYDTRSNFASTNPLWQIYYNTYSRNNPTSIHHFTGKKIPLSTGGYIDEFIDVKVKYTYGANFGTLPTEVEFNDANTGLPFYPQVPVATIKYQCQSILTPGN